MKKCNCKCLFKTSIHTKEGSLALLLLRLTMGLAFIQHGMGKIEMPLSWMGPESSMPGFLQFLAALSEFGGGIALILGLLTRLAGFGLTCTMLVAVYFHMVLFGDPFVSTRAGAYELPALYLMVAVLFMLVGAGNYSMDYVFFAEKKKK